MTNAKPHRIKTISEFHRFRNLPQPEHPLVSVINVDDLKRSPDNEPTSLILDFYAISIKKDVSAKIKYGQQQYDFDEGVMFFIAPNQVVGIGPHQHETPKQASGWMLLVHPDYLWNTSLATKIKQYEYFTYSVNEALFLSKREEDTMTSILLNIQQEYQSTIDTYSQDVTLAQLELLLTYADRFYHRQFLTRKISNHQLVNRLDTILTAYFNSEDRMQKGLPTVQTISDTLHVSVSYLSRVLRVLTGQSTQQHIHDKLIERAKEKLSTTDLSVSEIAYGLGFEHSQSFSKLFKAKTALSPLAFRQSFN